MRIFTKGSWISTVNIDNYEKDNITPKELKEIRNVILEYFEKNKLGLAINYIHYYILENEKHFFSSFKRKSFFRISDKNFKNEQIDKIITSILDHLSNHISVYNKLYLEQMLSIHKVAPECRNLLKSIKITMQKYNKSFIKVIYAATDVLFVKGFNP